MSDYKKSSPSHNGGGDDKIVKRPRRMAKRKVCQFCVDKQDFLDYKDISKVKRYITEAGKILPRRTSGVCAKHQRLVATAVKKARTMALIPFVAD